MKESKNNTHFLSHNENDLTRLNESRRIKTPVHKTNSLKTRSTTKHETMNNFYEVLIALRSFSGSLAISQRPIFGRKLYLTGEATYYTSQLTIVKHINVVTVVQFSTLKMRC